MTRYFVIVETSIKLLNGFQTKALQVVKNYPTKDEAQAYIEQQIKYRKEDGDEYRAFVKDIGESINPDGSREKGVYFIPRAHEQYGTMWENVMISQN